MKRSDKNKKSQTIISHPNILPVKFGEKAADKLSKWAGSWGFILGFIVFLFLWMGANIYAWTKTWDLYPFILLNLVLSCVAALQAPIILMSQNRSAQKDRQRAEYDYAVNRKAEREIKDIKKQLDRIERYLHK
jgi:uncharacterized membrane protein